MNLCWNSLRHARAEPSSRNCRRWKCIVPLFSCIPSWTLTCTEPGLVSPITEQPESQCLIKTVAGSCVGSYGPHTIQQSSIWDRHDCCYTFLQTKTLSKLLSEHPHSLLIIAACWELLHKRRNGLSISAVGVNAAVVPAHIWCQHLQSVAVVFPRSGMTLKTSDDLTDWWQATEIKIFHVLNQRNKDKLNSIQTYSDTKGLLQVFQVLKIKASSYL